MLGPRSWGDTRRRGLFVFPREAIALGNTEEFNTRVTQEKPQSFPRRFFSGIEEVTIISVSALLVSIVLCGFVAQMFSVPNNSMENTLKVGNRVLVAKFGGFQCDDVVVSEDPTRWLSGPQPERTQVEQALELIGVLPGSGTGYLIKRVIGTSRNRMAYCTMEGAVTANGEALNESRHLYSENGVQAALSTASFDVIVPVDHIFVLGNHRNVSTDSRYHLRDTRDDRKAGSAVLAPKNKVMGMAMTVVAPLDRLLAFRVPETFAKTPEPERETPAEPTIIETPAGC